MILFTNGCSWTYGSGLDESIREESVYAAQIAKRLNRTIVNLSAGCGSNQRILRTTFDWLTKQSSQDLENTIAVIQWTEESRYEYYVPNTKKSEDENWARVNVNVAISPNEDYDRSHERIKYRLETFTNEEAGYLMLAQTSALVNYLNYYKVKYYFWSPQYMTTHAYKTNIKNFMINSQNWINVPGNYERINGSADPHPSVNGHKEIAEYLLTFIK